MILLIEPLITIIQKAIVAHRAVGITLDGGKVMEIYPHRVTIIEGRLSLVGESCRQGALAYYSIEIIDKVVELEEISYRPNYTNLEVDGMISLVRRLSGNEHRLVVKFNHDAMINGPLPLLTPPYHHFVSPNTVFNLHGEMIWSATVELSDRLCSWLITMKDQIEILGTDEIRNSYYQQCKSLSGYRHIEGKKAS
ncbi:MAG: WYL domain-containing protein [Bdellovibrionales bacterium]|nr:WYL domain-containing protein [Bdellovibrionales bacterium]MBT3527407.1 WYL domain-containing protein [Bdellovibrionales bacterium]MBT7669682.1 WYL domain-containing protein [Bdellovibrionales bacterium]MBT7765660.1 WYL domain-containing protein [Bdellovibrionales bacterium]